MKLRLSALLACVACGVTSVAWAQMMTSATGPNLESMSYGLAGISPHNGPVGAKLGEGALFHAALGADVGYDSNVFYQQTPTGAAVAHVTPAVDLSNGERDGSMPDGVFYDLGASLTYREYLSGGDEVRKLRAFNPSLGGLLRVSSRQTVSFSLSDSFARSQDPPYSPGAAVITHDRNLGSAELKVAPGGGRIQLLLRYNNVLDLYEGLPYTNSNNVGNEGVLDLSWRWLPKTAFFMQVAQGAVTYLRPTSTGIASYPLKVTAGLRGLLTEKLGLNLAAGYTNAFYAAGGSNPSGFGNVVLVGEILYNMTLTSKAGLGYRHDFQNSPFVGNFYNLDAVYAALREYIGGRVATAAYARFENRGYQGQQLTQARTDQVVIAGITADYVIQRVFYIGVGYTLTLARTNNTDAAASGGVDYTKHLVVGRLGVVY
jgi:hypothetical protein